MEPGYSAADWLRYDGGHRIRRHPWTSPLPAGATQYNPLGDTERQALLPHRSKSAQSIHEPNAMEYFRCHVGISRTSRWRDKASQPGFAVAEFVHLLQVDR